MLFFFFSFAYESQGVQKKKKKKHCGTFLTRASCLSQSAS